MVRASLIVAAALVGLAVSFAAAAPDQPEAQATAVVSRVSQPSTPDQVSYTAEAPPTSDAVIPGYAYPGDGSVLRIGSANHRVVAQPGESSSAQAGVGALAVSIFNGEVTVESIDLRASAAAGSVSASSSVSASKITGLTVLGQLITPAANLVVPLADWGTLEVLGSSVETSQTAPRSASASVTAIRVKLIADHGGLPAGSSVEVGSVTVSTTAAPTVSAPTTTVKKTVPGKPTSRPVIPPGCSP